MPQLGRFFYTVKVFILIIEIQIANRNTLEAKLSSKCLSSLTSLSYETTNARETPKSDNLAFIE